MSRRAAWVLVIVVSGCSYPMRYLGWQVPPERLAAGRGVVVIGDHAWLPASECLPPSEGVVIEPTIQNTANTPAPVSTTLSGGQPSSTTTFSGGQTPATSTLSGGQAPTSTLSGGGGAQLRPISGGGPAARPAVAPDDGPRCRAESNRAFRVGGANVRYWNGQTLVAAPDGVVPFR
jgi:hypothetical protein